MGLSVPSTPFIVRISEIFGVSTDYLLGVEKEASIDVSAISEKEVALVSSLVECLRNKK